MKRLGLLLMVLATIGCEKEEIKTCFCETRADGVVTSSNYTEENSDIECFTDYYYFTTTLGTVIEVECGEL